MKTNWLRFRRAGLPHALSLALLAALTVASVSAGTNDLTATLQKGLFEEEANRNLDAAIAAYQTLATQFDKDRQVAATAIFRLGECYRKLGRTNEAAGQYQRIVREFSDQNTLATLSRQNLAGMGVAAAPPASSSLSAARERQRSLLEKQIQYAEEELARNQKLFDSHLVSQSVIREAEQVVLRLQTQLSALDASRPE